MLFRSQEALRQTMRQFGAKRGTVMVMDVHTGAMRAFAVEPTFDPNRYFDADLAWLKNWAVTDLYEPGSTFKPINVAIALEAGAATAEDTVYDEGQLRFDEWIIQNSDYEATGRIGTLTLTEGSEEHTSELQSQSTISYAVFCLKKKKKK